MLFPLGNLPPNVLHQNPGGSWSFVGRVDARLAYVCKDGSEPTIKQLEGARICGPGLVGLKTRTWPTKEAAEAFLASLQDGGTVEDKS